MTSPLLFLVRGLPGSGKTTLARTLSPECAVAADDFMVDHGGNYAFDPGRLRHCHERCRSQVDQWMLARKLRIVVHNTFSQRWEAQPYLDLAEVRRYQVEIVECRGQFGSIHGVPPKAIKRMRSRWQSSDDWLAPIGREGTTLPPAAVAEQLAERHRGLQVAARGMVAAVRADLGRAVRVLETSAGHPVRVWLTGSWADGTPHYDDSVELVVDPTPDQRTQALLEAVLGRWVLLQALGAQDPDPQWVKIDPG